MHIFRENSPEHYGDDSSKNLPKIAFLRCDNIVVVEDLPVKGPLFNFRVGKIFLRNLKGLHQLVKTVAKKQLSGLD